MANRVDPDETPHFAVCSDLFALILMVNRVTSRLEAKIKQHSHKTINLGQGHKMLPRYLVIIRKEAVAQICHL